MKWSLTGLFCPKSFPVLPLVKDTVMPVQCQRPLFDSVSSHPCSSEFITGHRTHEAHLGLFDLPVERKVLLAVTTWMTIYLPESPVGASGGQCSLWRRSLHSDGQAQLGGTASRCHVQEQPGL